MQEQEQEQEAKKTEDEEETQEENEHSFENCSTGDSNYIVMTDASNKSLTLNLWQNQY